MIEQVNGFITPMKGWDAVEKNDKKITGTERTMQIPPNHKDKLILQAYFCVCLVQQAAFGSVKPFLPVQRSDQQ